MKYFRYIAAAIILASAYLPLGYTAHAQNAVAEYKPYIVFDAILKDNTVVVHDSPTPPEEPNILEVTYLNLPAISTFEMRIDRLIQGIMIDVPPEYDHYGYEIRRYMARIGNPEIFENEERLRKELANVKRARIVFSYWQKSVDKEIGELEEYAKNNNISSVARSSYSKNKATVRSFMVALQGWIDSNERFLEHALSAKHTFESFYPDIVFLQQGADVIDFYNNFRAKQSRLEAIRKYRPFSIMVY